MLTIVAHEVRAATNLNEDCRVEYLLVADHPIHICHDWAHVNELLPALREANPYVNYAVVPAKLLEVRRYNIPAHYNVHY